MENDLLERVRHLEKMVAAIATSIIVEADGGEASEVIHREAVGWLDFVADQDGLKDCDEWLQVNIEAN